MHNQDLFTLTERRASAATRPDGDPRAVPVALSLRANCSWVLVGNVFYAACQWGMLVALAKLGSPDVLGQFALALAITAPIFQFTNLHLRAVQATDARSEFEFGDYFGLRIVTTTLAMLVVVSIVLVSGYRWEVALIILMVGMAKAFESLSDIFFGLLQHAERMDRIAKSMMAKAALSLFALAVPTYFTGSVVWGVVGFAAVCGLVLVLYEVGQGARVVSSSEAGEPVRIPRPRFESDTVIRLLRVALPLGLVMMLISLNTNIPRYFIERHLSERELGIFAALAYLLVAGNTVVAALGQAASPRLSVYYAGRNGTEFRRLVLILVAVGGLVGAAGLLMVLLGGRDILTLLYRPEYAHHTHVLLLLTIAGTIGYVASFLGYAMTAARYFRVQLPLFAAVTGSTLLASMWWVPDHGIRGAAMALIVSSAIQAAGSVLILIHAWAAIRDGVSVDPLAARRGARTSTT